MTVQQLTSRCGHHCGVKDGLTGHCPCAECHGQPACYADRMGVCDWPDCPAHAVSRIANTTRRDLATCTNRTPA